MTTPDFFHFVPESGSSPGLLAVPGLLILEVNPIKKGPLKRAFFQIDDLNRLFGAASFQLCFGIKSTASRSLWSRLRRSGASSKHSGEESSDQNIAHGESPCDSLSL
jgi:hypothetical protein